MAILTAGLLASGAFAFAAFGGLSANASVCGPGGQALHTLPGPVACVHEDEPPPGVDVTERVPTRELVEREGASRMAYDAAEDLGVPTTPSANASSPAVTCDGDGSSGYRVQAMYVVEAGATNRYSSLLASMKLWGAGVDDVVNRSAALTGGVRHMRFVTEPGAGGTCEVKVLNVTVPTGSLSSFNSEMTAVRALGYTDPTRKYLMWSDANVLCGIASMYTDDRDTQANYNNGGLAQYARVDNGCWGFGDGSYNHSVEAHELLHTLGGVQNTAPNHSAAGHCTDESDTMCYKDGAVTMRYVCPPEREYLYDCGTNDYFSTYPDPGSYLDTHWNAADSRFLIGGGDGTGGGTFGTPTTLGAIIGVNNPAVPGLATQVEVTPALPPGRTITSVAWKSSRSDCIFSTPTQLQSDVTCNATSASATTVTATLVDSTGAVKKISSPLTFAAGTQRPVSLSLAVAGQSGGTASVCTGAAFPLQATVTDVASGLPVKGLIVTFTKQTPTMTTPGTAGTGATTLSGAATGSGSATVQTTYGARFAGTTGYATATATSVVTSPSKCSPFITGSASATSVYYGDSVTVSGTLTRDVNGTDVPVAGASLPVRVSYLSGGVTKVLALGTAKTAADGSYSLTVKPTIGGTLSVSLLGSAAYDATSVALGNLTVNIPTTDLTAALDKSNVGYGDPVVVTGRLTKTAGAATSAVPSASVAVKVTAPGKTPTVVGTGRTLADGTFRVSVPLRLSGEMTVVYAGAAGLPADSVSLGSVTAGTWSTAETMSGTPYSTGFLLSGGVTKTYGGSTVPAGATRVKLYFTPSSTGVPALVTAGTTNAVGAWSARVYPSVSGSYQAVVSGVAGYADSSSGTFSVTR